MEYGIRQNNITAEVLSLFTPTEGINACYYGKVRNGKTRNATADILELLKRGEVVYANWNIDFTDYDERTVFGIVFASFVFGRPRFFKYKKDNFHYFKPDDIDVIFLSRLVGVHIFIDEGQWIFNSHIRDKADDPETIAKRKLILHGGHYCRSLNVITQRPSNILKDVRSQINIWYRCVKRLDFGNYMIFQRWAIEDMKDDMPIEFDKDNSPLGDCKTYFVNKKHDAVFASYNTHAMRAENAIERLDNFELYETTFKDRLMLLLFHILPAWAFKRHAGSGDSGQSADVVVQPEVKYLEVQRKFSGLTERKVTLNKKL